MRFRVAEQGVLLPHTTGRYVSFPSVARDPKTGQIIVLYREACYDPEDTRMVMRAHGAEGSLWTLTVDPETGRLGRRQKRLAAEDYETGFMDGILNRLGRDWVILSRLFPVAQPVTVGRGKTLSAAFKQGVLFPSATAQRGGAAWGKIVPVEEPSGREVWYQIYYGAPWDVYTRWEHGEAPSSMHRVALYASFDQGSSWRFINWIAPLYVDEAQILSANETALVATQGKLFAVMRTGGQPDPCPLYLTSSSNQGQSWNTPTLTKLDGQAPVFYTLPSGEILLFYRGYAKTAQGGTVCVCRFNPKTQKFSRPQVLVTYHGNHYDGGYVDVCWVEERQQLFIAYYASDDPETRYPGLFYMWLHINA